VRIAYSSTYGSVTSEVDNLTKQKVQKRNENYSKMYWQNMKSFVEQISIKLEIFVFTTKNKMKLVPKYAADEHTKISVEILI